MNDYKKSMVAYMNGYRYIIMVPVFYEYENKPSWRTVFTGTKKECEAAFDSFPDRLTASDKENKKNRFWKMKEADFLDSIGKHTRAARIRKIYHIA